MKCDESKCKLDLGVTGIHQIKSGDMDSLLEALSERPVSIAIDASPFSFYHSGVLEIKTNNLNHGVLGVGYELETEKPYIKIRNSWGARWGDSGYVKVSIQYNGGAADVASYATFKGDALTKLGKEKGKCDAGEKPDAAKNCLCTFSDPCDKKKPHGRNSDGCDDECGCGEFGYCR